MRNYHTALRSEIELKNIMKQSECDTGSEGLKELTDIGSESDFKGVSGREKGRV